MVIRMNKSQLRNKVLQALYKPGKGDVSSTIVKSMKDVESFLDEKLGKSGSDDKDEKEKDKE